MANDVDRRFLEEAVSRADLTPEQAEDCRRILVTLAEVDVALSAADVAVRKAFLTKEGADQIKRALARKRVGRYEVLDRLGRGGTGVVWRARDSRLGRIVALKLLARPRTPDDVLTTYHARFQREARTAVTLNHVNIVRGLDYGESDGYVFFAMEFVAGESAADRLHREGRIAENDALQIVLQVVEALEYVSAFDLVHRDLKPENLLLTPTGEVKVCDLGLAKPTLEEASRMGAAGTIAGTPLYMAPEQIRDPDSVDWRTDVYGLGATLYHLLTGRPPFLPAGGRNVIERQLHDAAADPREHVLELSAGASAVVLKMLAKDPSDRYASLADLGSDLSAVVDGRPPTHALSLTSASDGAVAEVLAETQGARARMGRGRGRVRRTAAAVLIAAGISGMAWGLLVPPDPPTEVPPQVRRVAAVEPDVPSRVERGTAQGPASPPADPGRAALARGRAMEREGSALDELIEHYRWVRDEHARHASGREAGERLAELEVALAARANQELMDRRQAASAFEEAGLYARARDELLAFPPLYLDTEAYETALAEAQRLTDEGRSRAKQWLADARVAAADGRFADAGAAIESARRVGLEGLDGAIGAAEQDVAFTQRTHDTLRHAQTAAYLVAAGRALMTSYSDEQEATRIVDAAHATLRTYRTELDALRGWLPLVRRARVRLVSTWQLWADESRELSFDSVGHPPHGYAGRALSSADGRLSLSGGGDGAQIVRPEALPTAILVEAISPGALEDASRLDEVAAFLLSLRRLEDAEALSAPPDLVDAVRAAAQAEIEKRLADVETLIDKGRRGAARDAVDAAIAYAPWCAAPWTALGALRAGAGDLDGAVESFQRSLSQVPRDPSAHFGIAAVYERRGKWQEAETHLRAFLEESASTEDERLLALRPDAEASLERVSVRRDESMLSALWGDVRKSLREGRAGDARRDLERILALRTDDPEALWELAALFAANRQTFPAYKALRRLAEAHPQHRRTEAAQREAANLRRRGGSIAAGREALNEGRTALRERRLGDALGAFRRAIQLSPFLAEAHLGLARSLEARGLDTAVQGDLRKAVESAGDALLVVDDFVPALLVRARCRVELSDLAGALADADRATGAKDAPSVSAAHIVAGRALLGLDKPREALARFSAAYEAHAHADPLFWQAVAYERRGDHTAARLRLDFLYDHWGAPAHLQERIERLDEMLTD